MIPNFNQQYVWDLGTQVFTQVPPIFPNGGQVFPDPHPGATFRAIGGLVTAPGCGCTIATYDVTPPTGAQPLAFDVI